MGLTHIAVTALREQPNSDAMRWLVSNLLNEYQSLLEKSGEPLLREQ